MGHGDSQVNRGSLSSTRVNVSPLSAAGKCMSVSEYSVHPASEGRVCVRERHEGALRW